MTVIGIEGVLPPGCGWTCRRWPEGLSWWEPQLKGSKYKHLWSLLPPGTWPLLCPIDPRAIEIVPSGLWLNAGWGRFQGNIPVALAGNVLSLHSGWKHKEQQRHHTSVSLHICPCVCTYVLFSAMPQSPFTTNTITYTPGWIIHFMEAT